MPCYHPLQAISTGLKPNGKLNIEFLKRYHTPDEYRKMYGKDYNPLPCGRCIGCRLERSRQWATRILHESQMHEENCFITLTYSDEHLPENHSLDYTHFQLFMKRLRKHFEPKKIRFFMCGEYGGKKGRPHYHACIFGVDFDDKLIFQKNKQGQAIYSSQTLENLWGKGFCTIGDLSFESAAYVARYVMKKITGKDAEEHYSAFVDKNTGELISDQPRVPEFCRMSNRSGVGANWLDVYHDDVYPLDKVIVRGHPAQPPRYYDKKLEEKDPILHEAIKQARQESAARKGRISGFDDSPDRLAVKEKVKLASIKALKRNLELEI